MIRHLSIAALAIFCIGCNALNIKTPTASITGMSVENLSANGFTMNFAVAVNNPNSVSIPLTSADYNLSLAGAKLLDGSADPHGSLPANSSRTITIPVTLGWDNLLSVARSLRSTNGDIPYTLSGGLSIDTGLPVIGKTRVPLEHSGTLKLKDLLKDPQILLQSPAARKLAQDLMQNWLSR